MTSNGLSSGTSPLNNHTITSNSSILSNAEDLALEERDNASRIHNQIDPLQVDRVFSTSVYLTNAAIQEFILQLCVVSLTECAGVSGRVRRVLNIEMLDHEYVASIFTYL